MIEVKTIGSSGQISLGKEHAGKTVAVEEVEPGVWLVRTARVIPENELWLHTPAAKGTLDRAIEWAEKHPPQTVQTQRLQAETRAAQVVRQTADGPNPAGPEQPGVSGNMVSAGARRGAGGAGHSAEAQPNGVGSTLSRPWCALGGHCLTDWTRRAASLQPSGHASHPGCRVSGRRLPALAFAAPRSRLSLHLIFTRPGYPRPWPAATRSPTRRGGRGAP